ncbi:MAG: YfaZ family outer membrane protein [Gammaproteobacteria bacterium]|jgi:hypothetical protein
MFKSRLLIAAMLLFCVHSAFADMLNVQLSNHTGRFVYSTESFGGQYGPIDMEGGLFFNQDNDKILHFGLMVRNDTMDAPLVISVGARAYYGDVGHKAGQIRTKFAAIAVGGELLVIPDNLGGFGFGAFYYLAPSVVTYMDANRFNEYGVRLNYEVTRQADISLGYRKISVDLNNNNVGKQTVDSSVYFGIGLRF